MPVDIERFTTTPQTPLNSTMKNLTTTSEPEKTPKTVLDASSAQTTPSTTPDRSQRAASPVRTLLSTYPEDERGEVGSALRNAADSLEKIGEAADKCIAEIKAELDRYVNY